MAGAEAEVEVLRLAARKLDAVDLADEIDHDIVAGLGRFALGARREGLGLLGEALEGLVDVFVGDLGGQTLDLKLGHIGQLEVRHQIDHDREFEVGLAVDHRFDLADEIDLRRRGRLEGIVGDGLGARFVDRVLHDLAHQRLAVLLLQERDRRLARAEALEVHARLHFFETAGEARVEVGLRHDDFILAAQAFGDGLGDLHIELPYFLYVLPRPARLHPSGYGAAPSFAASRAKSGAGGGT